MFYLAKVEINGIQEFIFNIKSKGAAKALKARSFFVDGVCQLLAKNIENSFANTQIIFSGGGNVYAKIPAQSWEEKNWAKVKKDTQFTLTAYHLHCAFSVFKWSSGEYAEALIGLIRIAQREKYRLHTTTDNTFEAFKAPSSGEMNSFIEFSGIYSRSESYEIVKSESQNQPTISGGEITLGDFCLQIRAKGKKNLLRLPVWTPQLIGQYNNQKSEFAKEEEELPEAGNIISFNHLAEFAKIRTGTGKLAVLKLDIDNLGKIFQRLGSESANRELSQKLNTFFSQDFQKLIEENYVTVSRKKNDGSFLKEKDTCLLNGKTHFLEKYKLQEEPVKFNENIYTVFAGGDDCFVLGAWDAVVNFALLLHEKFSHFQHTYIKSQTVLKNPLTLSAAILLIDPHFPVVRMAEIADQALAEAKQSKQNYNKKDAADCPMKSCIHFMGHNFSWDSFKEVVEVKSSLLKMVQEWGAPRAVLQRIIHSFESADNLYWHECESIKPFHPALLWRFMYSFRDIRHEPYFRNHFDSIFFGKEGYETKYVWNNFDENKKLSQVLPVAARWAELLSKK